MISRHLQKTFSATFNNTSPSQQGVFDPARFGGARPQIAQRYQTICVRNLRQNFWSRSQLGTAQSCARSGELTPFKTASCNSHIISASCQTDFFFFLSFLNQGEFTDNKSRLNRPPICLRFRKEALTAKYAVKVLRGLPHFRRTCSSTLTHGRTHVSTAGRGSTRNPT